MHHISQHILFPLTYFPLLFICIGIFNLQQYLALNKVFFKKLCGFSTPCSGVQNWQHFEVERRVPNLLVSVRSSRSIWNYSCLTTQSPDMLSKCRSSDMALRALWPLICTSGHIALRTACTTDMRKFPSWRTGIVRRRKEGQKSIVILELQNWGTERNKRGDIRSTRYCKKLNPITGALVFRSLSVRPCFLSIPNLPKRSYF